MIGLDATVVLVTGGRDYANRRALWSALDDFHSCAPIGTLVTGACHLGGADRLAEDWAKENEVDYVGCPAKFKTGKFGKQEGPLRNERMYRQWKPGSVVVCPGGRGTENMVEIARRGGSGLIFVGSHR